MVLVRWGRGPLWAAEDAATTRRRLGRTITCERNPTPGRIATGNATGVYFAFGTAYAEQVYQATDGRVTATAAETGASVQNIQQLTAGTYDVALSVATTPRPTRFRASGLRRQTPSIAALARIYTNYVQVIVRADAGIATVADLRGKRISNRFPQICTESSPPAACKPRASIRSGSGGAAT